MPDRRNTTARRTSNRLSSRSQELTRSSAVVTRNVRRSTRTSLRPSALANSTPNAVRSVRSTQNTYRSRSGRYSRTNRNSQSFRFISDNVSNANSTTSSLPRLIPDLQDRLDSLRRTHLVHSSAYLMRDWDGDEMSLDENDSFLLPNQSNDEFLQSQEEAFDESTIPPAVVDFLTKTETDVCAICLSDKTSPAFLMPCRHSFCHSCIDRWVSHRNTCPLCKVTSRRLVFNIISAERYENKELKSPIENHPDIDSFIERFMPSVLNVFNQIRSRNSYIEEMDNETHIPHVGGSDGMTLRPRRRGRVDFGNNSNNNNSTLANADSPSDSHDTVSINILVVNDRRSSGRGNVYFHL